MLQRLGIGFWPRRPSHPSAVCTLTGRPAPGLGGRAAGSRPAPAYLRGGRGEPQSKTREGRQGRVTLGATGHRLPGRLGVIAYRVLLLTPENSPPMGIGSPPPRWRCGLWHWASRAMKPMGNHRCSGWNTQESRACLVTGCGSSSIFSPKLQDTGTSALGSEPVGTGPPTTRIPGLELFGILLFPFYYLPKSHVYLAEESKGTMRRKTQPPPSLIPPTPRAKP